MFTKVSEPRPKVGLVLSGGAAHGLAHIGVIQYLEEADIPVDHITGTSMGAIIGGLYAMGYSGEQLEEIAAMLDWDKILNNEVALVDVAPVEKHFHNTTLFQLGLEDGSLKLPSGLINSDKLDVTLSSLFAPAAGIHDFSQLPRPFKCVASNLLLGEPVVLERGDLASAIRASMAIPSIFEPILVDSILCVDGGLLRNFPVEENIAMGSDFIIGSYVGAEDQTLDDVNSILDIMKQAAFISSTPDSKRQMELTDLLIIPDVKDEAVFGFADYQRFIKKGYHAAKKHFEKFASLSRKLEAYPAAEPVETLGTFGFLYVDNIEVPGRSAETKNVVLNKFGIEKRSYATIQSIEEGIERVYATKNFDRVNYKIKNVEGFNTVEINTAKSKNQTIGVNINHFSTTSSAIILSTNIRNLLLPLSNLRVVGRLSEKGGLFSEFYHRNQLGNLSFVFGAKGKVEKYSRPFYFDGDIRFSSEVWNANIQPFILWEPNNELGITLSYTFDRYSLNNKVVAVGELLRLRHLRQKASLTLDYNSLNYRMFASEGLHLSFSSTLGFTVVEDFKLRNPNVMGNGELIVGDRFYEFSLYVDKPNKLSKRWSLGLMGSAYFRSTPALVDNYAIGGTRQEEYKSLPFVGLNEAELLTNKHLYVRTELRWQWLENLYISLLANHISGRSEALLFLDAANETFLNRSAVGLGIGYATPIGPVVLEVGRVFQTGSFGESFSIGYRFIY